MSRVAVCLVSLLCLFMLAGCSGMPDEFQGKWSLDKNGGATVLTIDSSFLHYHTGNSTNDLSYEFIKKDEKSHSVLIQLQKEVQVEIQRRLQLSNDGKKLKITMAGKVFDEIKGIVPPSVIPSEIFTHIEK